MVISESLGCKNLLMRYQKFKLKEYEDKGGKTILKNQDKDKFPSGTNKGSSIYLSIYLKPLWGMTKF